MQSVEVDVYEADLVPGQIFLTCSDGLTGMVSDREICEIIKRNRNRIDQLPRKLIEAANAGGGRDNITVLISEVREA
jgi:protein phosphatase